MPNANFGGVGGLDFTLSKAFVEDTIPEAAETAEAIVVAETANPAAKPTKPPSAKDVATPNADFAIAREGINTASAIALLFFHLC